MGKGYFSELPTIYYDFNIANENEVRIIRDISTNIRFKKEVLNDILLFDEYDIIDGETPEIISEKAYGTPHYHWLIMLLNERYDYINDFPLSTQQLYRHVDETYGSGNRNAIHHYIDNLGHTMTSIEPYYDPDMIDHIYLCKLEMGSNFITASVPDLFANHPDSGYIHQISGEGLPIATVVTITSQVSDSILSMSHAATDTIEAEIRFIHVVDDSLYATPKTNLEYETELNETKRRIKLLHPTVIDHVIGQLKALTNG